MAPNLARRGRKSRVRSPPCDPANPVTGWGFPGHTGRRRDARETQRPPHPGRSGRGPRRRGREARGGSPVLYRPLRGFQRPRPPGKRRRRGACDSRDRSRRPRQSGRNDPPAATGTARAAAGHARPRRARPIQGLRGLSPRSTVRAAAGIRRRSGAAPPARGAGAPHPAAAPIANRGAAGRPGRRGPARSHRAAIPLPGRRRGALAARRGRPADLPPSRRRTPSRSGDRSPPAGAPRRAGCGGRRRLASAPPSRRLPGLEALWRGVHLLTHGVESDADVRLYLFDVTKAELAADQQESADAGSSRVSRLLSEPPAAAPASGWGALGGLYTFAPDAADLELLGRLGTIASLVGAPWISAADPRLAGCDSIHSTPDPVDWVAEPLPEWQAARRIPAARWIGLAMPRFLLRLPYGERGRPCEVLLFEEPPDGPAHDEYLWGNPALACLLLLVQGVAESGRPLHPGMTLEIGGLPLPAARRCAETLLGEQAAERILDRGLMPLVCIRDTDRVRLLRFQSIADPATVLGGRWGSAPGG